MIRGLVALNNNYVTLPELEGFHRTTSIEDNAGILAVTRIG